MQPLNIIYTISESAKSKVYLVEDASGNPAILKCRSNASGDIYRRLQKEKLSCVPDIYEIEDSEDGVSVLEEQVSGITVRDALDQNSIKGGKELTDILLKICGCMILLHKCEPPIIYRDLKPENILITDDGKVMLIDFDAARDYKEDSEHDTVMLGTREYAAPEQYGFSQTDIRTDVYSFGIIMKEMVEAAGINGICRRNLDELIRQTTMFDPEDRPADFSVIEKKLERIYRNIQNPSLKFKRVAIPAAAVIVIICAIFIFFRVRNEYYSSLADSWDASAYAATLNDEKIQAEEQTFSQIDLSFDGDEVSSRQWFNETDDGVAFWGYPDDVEAQIVKIDSNYEGKPVTIFDCYCLCGRSALKEVVISVGYSRIEDNALHDDPNLTAVYIPATVTYIAETAFDGSPNAVIYCTEGSYAQFFAKVHRMKCVLID